MEHVVPDMSKLTYNEYQQLKYLIVDYGADYVINAVRHIKYLESLKAKKEGKT